MEVILVKYVTLNYPRQKTEPNRKMREVIDGYFGWVEHDARVVTGIWSDWTQTPVYRIYDPQNELQELFDDVSTLISKQDDVKALLDDTVVSIIDVDTGIDREEFLGNLRPYSHRSEPMHGDNFGNFSL
tara:strand:+ start:8239 stop:8625 length:387 start_codon:yes stop_codon:yes gene_type:complete